MTLGKKFGIALVALAVAACGLWIAAMLGSYSREHWMGRADWPVVKVDDRPVSADVYIGTPTHYESDAISLVRAPGVGDYFLNFDGESYRDASHHEFIDLLGGGVWTSKPMGEGHFSECLPMLNINEFRFSSHGHTLTVQF
ncbi:MAG: hypothetical protein QOK38_3407 [Acidobacteriaceae bacterium]|jgi:hypothetical protein|nr:hypothetical protein [Acidobacteriaceae bacterium]